MKKLLYYLLILSFIFVIGCGQKTSNYTFVKGSEEDIVNFITHTNKVKAILYSDTGDNEYALPTKEWVENVFTPYYKQFLFDNKLNTFKEGRNDCDKYVNYALTCGYLLFNKEEKMGEASLAIGEFNYFDSLVRHAIIFFIINEDGNAKMMFYEPQVQQFFELTNEQKQQLCTNWRM